MRSGLERPPGRGELMAELVALTVSLDENLAEFSRWMNSQGIPHRITEQSGEQAIWVATPAMAEVVRRAYQG